MLIILICSKCKNLHGVSTNSVRVNLCFTQFPKELNDNIEFRELSYPLVLHRSDDWKRLN